MEPYVEVHFYNLTQDQAANLFASIRCDYKGPAPVVEPTSPQVSQGTQTPAEVSPATPATPVTKRTRKPKDPSPSRSGPAGEPVGGPHVATAGESVAATRTIDDARAALSKLLEAKGMSACTGLLQEFGATRIGEVPAEKYGALIEAAAAKAGVK